MLTLYNVISSDGYIMTKEGDESFIPDSIWPTVLDVFRQYDIMIMGKGTYQAFQGYGEDLLKPFEELDIRKAVISRDVAFKPKSGYEVAKNAEDIVRSNPNVVVSSGPGFNNHLFEKKLIDKLILHKLSAALGEGIKPFDDTYMGEFVLQSTTQIGIVEELVFVRAKSL